MKYFSIYLFLICFSITAISQNLWFDVRGNSFEPVGKDVLVAAKTMSDFNEGYPSSWIKNEDYVSSQITGTCNGKVVKALGINDVLTDEQKNLLKKVDLFTDVEVEVKYSFTNLVTKITDIKTMNFSVSNVPKVQAEYCDGYEELKAYLKVNAVGKISDSLATQNQQIIVKFVIDEEGAPSAIEVTESSLDDKIDKMLMDTISKMPKWKPAENSEGVKIKQEFFLSIGFGNC